MVLFGFVWSCMALRSYAQFLCLLSFQLIRYLNKILFIILTISKFGPQIQLINILKEEAYSQTKHGLMKSKFQLIHRKRNYFY